METRTRVLILEHDPNDIGLLLYELKKSGLDFSKEIVETRDGFEGALRTFQPDIILSDFSLPTFDGLSAFKIKQCIQPDTPFIIVSGTIGEENAVNLIKMGVTDYVLKERLYQIAPKIERALREAEERSQKKIAELQLKQREEQLQKIMDFSLDVICTFDEYGRFLEASAASMHVLGYQPEELKGKSFTEFVHEEDIEVTSRVGEAIRQGEIVLNFENRYIRKDGTVVPLIWSARWDAEESLIFAIAKDATDLKKAEEELRNREKRFRALLQNSTDGFSLLAEDGTVIERSAGALRMLGLSEDEIPGRAKLDMVHPDDVLVVGDAFLQVRDGPDRAITAEFRMKMPDGTYKWLETIFHNQLHEPAVGAIVLNFRDITERKLSEIALEKSEEKYRSLFNLSPIPMWVYDPETLKFLDVNAAAVRHYGYSKEEFLAMTLKGIRPEEDTEELENAVRRAVQTGGFARVTSRHIKKSGEIIYVEIQGNSIELNGKEARVILATDISERLKYIQAIEEQNVKLREIAWMQSHVVRAPLARMMGLIDLLKYPSGKENATEILNYVQTSAHQLDDIIRDIVKRTEQVKELPA